MDKTEKRLIYKLDDGHELLVQMSTLRSGDKFKIITDTNDPLHQFDGHAWIALSDAKLGQHNTFQVEVEWPKG